VRPPGPGGEAHAQISMRIISIQSASGSGASFLDPDSPIQDRVDGATSRRAEFVTTCNL